MYDGSLVRLRAIEIDDDLPVLHRWFNDAEVTYYLASRYPRSRDTIRELTASWGPMSLGSARFLVERRDSGDPVGLVALRDAAPENREAELDLLIGERSAWGQGFGTDTVRTTCRFGFEEMGLHRIQLFVFADHAAAIKVYERVGFVHEGVIRRTLYKRGAWHDLAFMGLLSQELRPAPQQ